MKTYLLFLAESSLALTLFYAVYWFFLRKETFFRANRYFLTGAMLLSVIIPLFPVRYQTLAEPGSFDLRALTPLQGNTGQAGILVAGSALQDIILPVLTVIYLTGAVLFLIRLVIQTARLLRIFHASPATVLGDVFIIENQQYRIPFSFINLIFYNPEYHDREELEEIIAHEQVHIHEHHWIDLLVAELWGVVFWFNPFVWLLERSIRQNHEYLADAGVLAQGRPVGRYQALLINQLMGSQVLALANHLNFSLNATRFKMMTKKETPKIRMMRLTWALPVLALLLVAFAQPNIRQSLPGEDMSQGSAIRVNPADEVTISGEVVRPDGKPLPGASVVIGGTVQGTLSDKDGYFELRIPENQTLNLVVSYVGFESKVTRIDTPSKNIRLKIEMKEAIFNIGPPSGKVAPPPPPPPPSDPVKADAPVLKEASSHAKEVVFIVVEELPQYPGGEHDLQQYITEMQQKLVQAKGIHGKVSVEFTVDNEGHAVNPVIRTKDNEQVGLAALEIVNNMQQWKPGKQRGKPVPVKFLLPVEF